MTAAYVISSGRPTFSVICEDTVVERVIVVGETEVIVVEEVVFNVVVDVVVAVACDKVVVTMFVVVVVVTEVVVSAGKVVVIVVFETVGHISAIMATASSKWILI